MIIGYTHGAFDLFHAGHVKLLRSCKEQCDHLIVGVNSDEETATYKETPVRSLKDRCDILRSVRYVDRVIERHDRNNLLQEWHELRFQIMFIGSDWQGTERYKKFEELLKPVGARIVYHPYTDGISSSLIRREMISRGMI